ncbi:amidase signature domain-containing protein [Xylariales sp. AK1849]|nr:amidase signature domain-containing protein [Xylariales sp. AK1849]
MISRSPTNCSPQFMINATSDQLICALHKNQFSSVELVEACQRRIEEVNHKLHVVLELNPDALSIATQLDLERSQGRLRGPLHGLPILIKGNIGTRDQMQTNAGSYALQDTVLPADSTVVVKLRSQGLILLGKASLTEWSMFRSDHWPHAWNPISGQAYGAYYPRQCPGGSSGGSAVAVDLGLAWATLGTETDGSIVIPSGRNNVVGIKPTVGLTSRHLIVPISEHQDTIGPIARTVKDAAKLLQVIVGHDVNDKYTLMSPFINGLPDYLAACKLCGLQGKRIGIAWNVIGGSANEVSYMMDAFHRAVPILSEAGATIIDCADFTAYDQWKKRKYNPVPRADFAANFPQYMSQLDRNPNKIYTVEDLRAFTQEFPDEEYPFRNTSVWDNIIETGAINTSPQFPEIYQRNLRIGGEGGIEGAIERHNLDAVILPTPIASSLPALIGSPIITVPLGSASADVSTTKEVVGDAIELAPGLPFGISFLGSRWSEETLLGIAYAFEQLTLVRDTLQRHIESTFDIHPAHDCPKPS